MKAKKYVVMVLMFIVTGCWLCATLYARQGTGDSTKLNNTGTGIPNSGNTLYPNNGPEFPHSSFPSGTTDPGPLTPGTNGNMVDTVPHFNRLWFKQ